MSRRPIVSSPDALDRLHNMTSAFSILCPTQDMYIPLFVEQRLNFTSVSKWATSDQLHSSNLSKGFKPWLIMLFLRAKSPSSFELLNTFLRLYNYRVKRGEIIVMIQCMAGAAWYHYGPMQPSFSTKAATRLNCFDSSFKHSILTPTLLTDNNLLNQIIQTHAWTIITRYSY